MPKKSMLKYHNSKKRRLASRVTKPLGVKSRTYEIRPNSIIGYKKPRDMSEEDFSTFIDRAANDVLARFGISTIVVGVEDWNELRILDEETMERHGWVRTDRVYLMNRDVELVDEEE